MFLIPLLAAAAIPTVPGSSVLVAQEGAVYAMRNQIDDTPLYTFDQDQPGKSNCDDACAALWRPLRVIGSEQPVGNWSQISRDDGSLQWAYDGMPVYSFAQDPEPVKLGNGRLGNWKRLPTFPVQ